jgi:hypothetical protein
VKKILNDGVGMKISDNEDKKKENVSAFQGKMNEIKNSFQARKTS